MIPKLLEFSEQFMQDRDFSSSLDLLTICYIHSYNILWVLRAGIRDFKFNNIQQTKGQRRFFFFENLHAFCMFYQCRKKVIFNPLLSTRQLIWVTASSLCSPPAPFQTEITVVKIIFLPATSASRTTNTQFLSIRKWPI